MKKIVTLLLALMIPLGALSATPKNPGRCVEVEPDPAFLELLVGGLTGDQFGDVEYGPLCFYKDYGRAYEYFYNEIENASYANGQEDAMDFDVSFPKFPEMKEYLAEYGVMSMDIYLEIFAEGQSYDITYTVLYLVDADTEKVSFWTISNDF